MSGRQFLVDPMNPSPGNDMPWLTLVEMKDLLKLVGANSVIRFMCTALTSSVNDLENHTYNSTESNGRFFYSHKMISRMSDAT